MLKTLELQNFTVFKEATLNFSPGLNVIIGENGTGKSHLLKLGYAVLTAINSFGERIPARDVAERTIANRLVEVFRPETVGRLASRTQGSAASSVSATWGAAGTVKFSFSTRKTEKVDIEDIPHYKDTPSSLLFIPPKEILSVFDGFQATLEKRELAFDATYLDLAKALNTPPLKGKLPSETAPLVERLEEALSASIEKKDNCFYFIPKANSGQIEAPLVAEGHRKIGMLAYLVLNGELRKRSSLFWDEPEANLNPRLLVKLAQVLVELSKIMQITIATHSLFLLRELEILQEKQQLQNARYFGLHFADGGWVNVRQGDTSNDIGDIAALEANLDQSTRYLQMDEDF